MSSLLLVLSHLHELTRELAAFGAEHPLDEFVDAEITGAIGVQYIKQPLQLVGLNPQRDEFILDSFVFHDHAFELVRLQRAVAILVRKKEKLFQLLIELEVLLLHVLHQIQVGGVGHVLHVRHHHTDEQLGDDVCYAIMWEVFSFTIAIEAGEGLDTVCCDVCITITPRNSWGGWTM